MKLCGLNKTTLLDYPGKVAATIFLDSCNFRCPFCHNRSLVLEPAAAPSISTEELLAFLQKRRGILEGVCVSGGEPTLHADLPALLKQIRSLGYAIKLDTNGSRPEVIRSLHQQGLIDMVAMDIKAAPEHYPVVCGVPFPELSSIRETVEYLMNADMEYEFRTTVVKELHTISDFQFIGQWIAGAKAYFLQAYKDSDQVISPGFSSYSKADLEEFQKLLQTTIARVEIRGID